MEIQITNLLPTDERYWRRLYSEYMAADLSNQWTEDKADLLWSWLMSPAHPVQGLVARVGSQQIVAFIHFQELFSCHNAGSRGYVDDLYVDPFYRRQGIGTRLISAVVDRGHKAGWKSLRWLTHADNNSAQKMYDPIANRLDRILYELLL